MSFHVVRSKHLFLFSVQYYFQTLYLQGAWRVHCVFLTIPQCNAARLRDTKTAVAP